MRVFITGASGFIGKALIPELIKNGHEPIGLARNETSAETLIKLGAKTHKGDIEDLESLKTGAKTSDGVVHLAFHHEYMFKDFTKACEVDRAAIQALAEGLAGSGKPLVMVTGTLMMKKGQLAYEDDEPDRSMPVFSDRIKSSDLVKKLSKELNIRGMEVRLSPTVHDVGDKGFIPMFINAARKAGKVVYLDDGSARWPPVHRKDAAVALRLALENGKAGASYHAIAEEGVSMKEIQGLIGKKLGIPVESKSHDDHAALEHLGFLGHVFGLDNPSSNKKTREELKWTPREIGLLEDMEANYFNEVAESKAGW